MLFLTNDAPDAAAAVSEAASAVGAALEDGTASTVGFFQKIFGGFSWTKLISAAILLVVCGVLIKLILKATDRMLGRSRLDKAVHPFIRTIVKLVLLFTAIMLIAGTLGVDTSSLLALLSVVLGVVMIVDPFGAMETLVMAIGVILIIEGALNLLSALYTMLAVRRFVKLHPEAQSVLEAVTGQDLNGDGVIAPDVARADAEATAVELDHVDESAEVEQENDNEQINE